MDNFAFDPFLRALANDNFKVWASESNSMLVASCLFYYYKNNYF